jgi:hypothetical protein
MSENTARDATHDDDLKDEALDERHGAKGTFCCTCVMGKS